MFTLHRPRVVLVTGASAGIGAALAREAAQRGAAVALLARRSEPLNALAHEIRSAGGRALALVADVTSSEQLQAAVQQTLTDFGGLDTVFANAGFGVKGNFDALNVEDYQRQFDTNVFGVLRTLEATLPALKASHGTFGVVGSLNGYLDLPGWSAYCMSKAALRSLCACIRHELSGAGVGVTHLAPGMIQSDFRRVDNLGVADASVADPVPDWLAMPSKKAAQQMFDAVLRREDERVITWHAKGVVALERHAHWLVRRVIGLSGPLIQRFSKPK
jgi:NADP-dependent 3-hydroxy acid dehydrogenase YdfG